jgi:hypothetical protein
MGKVDRTQWIAANAADLPERVQRALPETDDEEALRKALNEIRNWLWRRELHGLDDFKETRRRKRR